MGLRAASSPFFGVGLVAADEGVGHSFLVVARQDIQQRKLDCRIAHIAAEVGHRNKSTAVVRMLLGMHCRCSSSRPHQEHWADLRQLKDRRSMNVGWEYRIH